MLTPSANTIPGAELDSVLDSYHRCERGGRFFDDFYEIFFAKSPEIPPMFANTEMQRQKQDLMASLLLAIRFARGESIARQYAETLAVSHSRIGHAIRPALYRLWLDALCEAVQKHDPAYTPELGQAWRKAMRPTIELMISSY